jgi:hypothetical protein
MLIRRIVSLFQCCLNYLQTFSFPSGRIFAEVKSISTQSWTAGLYILQKCLRKENAFGRFECCSCPAPADCATMSIGVAHLHSGLASQIYTVILVWIGIPFSIQSPRADRAQGQNVKCSNRSPPSVTVRSENFVHIKDGRFCPGPYAGVVTVSPHDCYVHAVQPQRL